MLLPSLAVGMVVEPWLEILMASRRFSDLADDIENIDEKDSKLFQDIQKPMEMLQL